MERRIFVCKSFFRVQILSIYLTEFSDPGNEMALKQARWNLVNHYLLVGLTERMNDTIELLEHLIPSFFRGASEHFRSLNGGF